MASIVINIDPTLLRLGHFGLRWYSLIVILAAVVGITWTWRAARREGFSAETVTNLALWAIPGGIVGSRLLHVIDQLDYYWANPAAIIGGSGQAIYGAILGGTLAAWIGAKVHRLPFARLADLAAPGLLLAQATGRIVDILTGDATGTPTDLPWAFVYTNPNTMAPVGVAVHPAVAYEFLWDLTVFAILLRLRGRLEPPGSLFATYLALYSLGRFFITFTRANDPFLFGLYQAQVVALAVLAVTIPWLVSRTRIALKQKEAGQDGRDAQRRRLP